MALHLKWSVKVLVAVLALGEVCEVEVLLLLTVYVALHVHHQPDIVVQHFVAVPALKHHTLT